MWVESEEYSDQSSLENSIYNIYREEIKTVVGKNVHYRIEDAAMNLVCTAERAGFENGLRYGVMFVINMLIGGTVY